MWGGEEGWGPERWGAQTLKGGGGWGPEGEGGAPKGAMDLEGTGGWEAPPVSSAPVSSQESRGREGGGLLLPLALEGWEPKPRKVGPRRVGPRRVGAPIGAPKGWDESGFGMKVVLG